MLAQILGNTVGLVLAATLLAIPAVLIITLIYKLVEEALFTIDWLKERRKERGNG